jgi:hypothetical protein
MTGSFNFWVAFITALRSPTNLEALVASPELKVDYDLVLDQSFRSAILQLDLGVDWPQGDDRIYSLAQLIQTPKVSRVVELMDVCLATQ